MVDVLLRHVKMTQRGEASQNTSIFIVDESISQSKSLGTS